MTEHDIDQLAEDALNAACLAIQEQLGQTDGGIAGIFFSGPNGENAKRLFAEYIRLEIRMAEC